VLLQAVPHAVVVAVVLFAHAWFLWYLQTEYEAIPDKSQLPLATDYVDMWVPVFFISIIAEAGTRSSSSSSSSSLSMFDDLWFGWTPAAWLKYKQVRIYRINDSLCSISLGLLSLVVKKLAAQAVRAVHRCSFSSLHP